MTNPREGAAPSAPPISSQLLTEWAVPSGRTLGAGARLLVWADGEPGEMTPEELHAGFRLHALTGRVVLARQVLGRTIVLDYLTYDGVGADFSYGSYPEGSPYARQVFHYPTPGQANSPTSLPVAVRINEWMTDTASPACTA